jgi:radical SAM protein with 4Fe4S-binding SPASM domain
MTKEQFLSGVHFTIGTTRRGDSTYCYEGSAKAGHICRQIRSAIDQKIILDDYECNISKIGRVGFVGFGEPLLHSNLEECIRVVRDILPHIPYIEVNTNGDLLTDSRIRSLYKSGCTTIAVSMYDRDLTRVINEKKGDTPIDIIFRHHYNPDTNFNLNIVNRSNITYGTDILNLSSKCYIPFYKLMIDWNGDLLPCDNDWSRTLKFGNINNMSLKDIIESESFFDFRAALTKGKRTQIPCSKCNVCGTLRGEQEFDNFKQKHDL